MMSLRYSIMLEVARQVHRRHTACAELAFEPVPVGKGSLKSRWNDWVHVPSGPGKNAW